ncbi:MAG: acyl-CoA thioesterase [Spirochaetes bacterium]|nr:acyl-CoA thioesterase [Spirochaetota bacterium]
MGENGITVSYALMPGDANPSGNVHGGVIMKHIDNTAAIVAFRHARINVVTASIDRLDFHNPAYVGNLLTLKANLNLVGRTSMEVGVRVEAENLLSGEVRHIASAYLTFVALDKDHKPVSIAPYIPQSDDGKRRNSEALERKKMRLLEKRREKKN